MHHRPHARALAAGLLSLVLAACTTGQATPFPSNGSRTSPPATATSEPSATRGPDVTPDPNATPYTGPAQPDRVSLTLEPFVQVDGRPLAMAWPPDGTNRLFVATQDGFVWVVKDGAVLPDAMLDLRDRTQGGGEQGLLGIAVHPRHPEDPRVFVHFTDKAGDTVVASYEVDPGNPDRLDPGTARDLLFVDQPYANHNGGALAFGPDGYLYVSLGDGGSGGDPHDNGQRLDTLLGKILRLDIDVSGDADYEIPEDNPFASTGGMPEIWHYGLRNPWRMSFDRVTGQLWIGDVGQSAFEEIDAAPAGVGGLNFGWNRTEGNHCFGGRKCTIEDFVAPVAEYGRDLGCTVIDGYVYRGTAFPVLGGSYVFADYCEGRLMAIDPAAPGTASPITVGFGSQGISGFGEDAAGELYITNLNGQVSRVVATER
jgi:glucose/arabinose dehydrogenase